METRTIANEQGRKQEAYIDGDAIIPIGPPIDLVDKLELPEPFATKLHNALHQRGILSYQGVVKNPKSVQGALQEVLNLDVQRLTEMFYRYEQEAQHAR